MLGPLPDFGLLPNTSVTVIRRQEVGTDPFNAPIYENVSEDVAGVLITPGATSDLDASRPEGVRVAYTIHFPKSYAKTLKGCLVQYLGDTYRIIGDPQHYMADGTPGPWDMPAEVERVDG